MDFHLNGEFSVAPPPCDNSRSATAQITNLLRPDQEEKPTWSQRKTQPRGRETSLPGLALDRRHFADANEAATKTDGSAKRSVNSGKTQRQITENQPSAFRWQESRPASVWVAEEPASSSYNVFYTGGGVLELELWRGRRLWRWTTCRGCGDSGFSV